MQEVILSARIYSEVNPICFQYDLLQSKCPLYFQVSKGAILSVSMENSILGKTKYTIFHFISLFSEQQNESK